MKKLAWLTGVSLAALIMGCGEPAPIDPPERTKTAPPADLSNLPPEARAMIESKTKTAPVDPSKAAPQ
jgi:hypothetical protein